MTRKHGFRQYVVFRAAADLLAIYRSGDLAALHNFTQKLLGNMHAPPRLLQKDTYKVVSAPSLNWGIALAGAHDSLPLLDELLVSYAFADPDLYQQFRDLLLSHQGVPLDDGNMVLGIGADPGAETADSWCPGGGGLSVFGRRADARRLLGVDALHEGGLRGRRANVVIVDGGLNRHAIPAANWGGGLSNAGRPPGSAPRTSHGMAVARNILDIVPEAVVYDVPLLPERIDDVPAHAVDAHAAYAWLRLIIPVLRLLPRWSGPWVLVNAWAISDRRSERPLLGDYTENKHPFGHPFNNIVGRMAQQVRVDVVFAAGNCGTFCPSARCGRTDRGPGRSIWGANSHSAAITAGAVRTDAIWLGYSSQGPGQPLLGTEKPDFCAPSQFRETTDAFVKNTGTSTACALTAGVVAALRSNPRRNWDSTRVTPYALRQRLIRTTRRVGAEGWNGRLGYGILDAAAALARLSADFP